MKPSLRVGFATLVVAVVVTPNVACGPSSWTAHPAASEPLTSWDTESVEVDSEYARYYLEHYAAGRIADPDLHARLQRITHELDTPPTSQQLQAIATEYSVDLAALLLADVLTRHAPSRRIQGNYATAVRQAEAAVAAGGAPGLTAECDCASLRIAFAPGWFYRRHPDNGADFRDSRALLNELGLDNDLILTDENGSVEANASVIADYVRRAGADGRDLVLVSASKSGPEVALALGELLSPDEARGVRAWVNIVGVLRGTPLADLALSPGASWVTQLLLWRDGLDDAGLRSMTTAHLSERAAALELPEHILVVNYLGIPLSGEVSEDVQRGYRNLRPYGPNDGLTLLADSIVPSGVTVFEPGLDHMFRHPQIHQRVVALYDAVLVELERRGAEHATLTRAGLGDH